MPLVALSSIALASAAASGRLDPTFSGDGWVRSYDQTGYTRGYFPRGAEDIALQPDGKILATGEIQDGGSEHYFGVYRWTSTGELDASFGEGGWAVTKVGEVAFPRAVAVQRDGKIIVA
ncbi:MAG TPA: delta-60 repeat domain-containing protein, partial [Gaiellaceae bacterium]|nr:delta-60 repeat domain-containing protein [Gaiellaceae bacterium]